MRAAWMMTGLAMAFAALTPHHASAFTAFVSNEKGNTLSVIDTDKMEVIATIPVGQRPRGITISKDRKTVFVCTSDADHIEAIDADTFKLVRTLPSGADPELFAPSPDGKFLYVANEDNAMVSVLDIDQAAINNEVSVGVE